MIRNLLYPLSRRTLLKLPGLGLAGSCGLLNAGETTTGPLQLTCQTADQPIVGGPYPMTPAWTYNGQLPGPTIRTRQDSQLNVNVNNELPQATTVHWHGLRIANNMDGMPWVSQEPILPGESFEYSFKPPDAGTYWYHSHYNGAEQVGRGLYGPLIVEEPVPVAIDRELVWMLDDWMLKADASIADTFGNLHEASHGGRIGNTITVNGKIRESEIVHTGERIRLRLINAANARFFALRFEAMHPWIIAIDGQPVDPHYPDDREILLGPGMRMDLLLDCTGKPGDRTRVIDSAYQHAYRVLDLQYSENPVENGGAGADPVSLPVNPVFVPDTRNAETIEILLDGGVHSQMTSARYQNTPTGVQELARQGIAWALNGVAGHSHKDTPIMTLDLNNSYRLKLVNKTRFSHPMHIHGHHFLLLSRNEVPVPFQTWQDTVLIDPGETVELGLHADNPGLWMFHCHILEHQIAGMKSMVLVR